MAVAKFDLMCLCINDVVVFYDDDYYDDDYYDDYF